MVSITSQPAGSTGPTGPAGAGVTTKLVSPAVRIRPIDFLANGSTLKSVLDETCTLAATTPGTLWLVKIEPGTYDLGPNELILCPQVDVEGSGEGVTLIKSQAASTVSAGFFPVGELRSVSIDNATVLSASHGALMGNGAWSFRHVTLTVTGVGGQLAVGILSGEGLGTMDHVTVIATGGDAAIGVWSPPGGAGLNISDSAITVKDASSNTGIATQSLLLLLNSKVASTGTDIEAQSGIAKVYGSILMGTTLLVNTGFLNIATSEVAATSFVTFGPGTFTCISSFTPLGVVLPPVALPPACH